MKKYKSIIFVFAFFLLVGFIVYSIFKYSEIEKTFKITTIRSSYSVIEAEDLSAPEIIIPIYLNSKKSNLVDEKKVISSYIVDKGENNLKLSLKEIIYDNRELYINKERFYCYCFKFKISDDLSSGFNFLLNDAFLKLSYLESSITIGIGSFSYYKVPYFWQNNSTITITNLKGIVNNFNNEKRIMGIVIGIRNNSNNLVTINGSEILDVNYKISGSEVIVLEDIPLSNESINNLLGYSYDYTKQTDIAFSVTIGSNETKYILIPIKSVSKYYPNNFGLLINYNQQNSNYSYYLDNFTFFSTDSTEIGDLEVLTYENK